MPFQIACKLYKSSKLDIYELKKKLEGYREVKSIEGVSKPLIENIENFYVLEDENSVSFTFLYDYIVSIPYRDETQKVLLTASADVKIIDPLNKNLYFIYTSMKVANSIRKKLSKILSSNNYFIEIENVNMSPDVLKEVVKRDAIEVKYGWWDNIEMYAKKGALRGNLSQSEYYVDFNSSGKPILVMFESQHARRTIRLSTKGNIVFYGKGVTKQDIEDYVEYLINNNILTL